MKIMRRQSSILKKVQTLTFAVAILIATALSSFTPFLQQQASAETTGNSAHINLPQRGIEKKPYDKNIPFGTCTPYFEQTLKDNALLSAQFYKNIGELPYNDDVDKLREEYRGGLGRDIQSYIGTYTPRFSDTNEGHDEIVNILKHKGTERITVMRFRASPQGAEPLDGTYSANNVCDNYVAIPINDNTWRGFEWFNSEYRNEGGDEGEARYKFFEYTNKSSNGASNTGTIRYWTVENGGGELSDIKANDAKRLIVSGTIVKPSQEGGATTVGTLGATWVDAATIKVNANNGAYSGETYKKYNWDTRQGSNGTYYSYYFLDSPSASRGNLSWNSQSKRCDNPLPVNNACGGAGAGNCVPFIAVQQKLNLSVNDTGLGSLQQNIDQLGGGAATFIDYNPSSCLPSNGKTAVTLGAREKAKIWLYYSDQAKAFTNVFANGDGNEAKFIGQYGNVSAGVYRLGTCNSTMQATPTANVFTVKWTLTDGNCASPKTYGTLNVSAMGGAAGEAAFTGSTEDQQKAVDTGEQEIKFACDLEKTGAISLNWIICPMVRIAISAVDGMENMISSMLTINTNRIFNENAGTSGQRFHDIWAGFRTFALALIAIAALVMVISQAAGVDVLDAYTVKKIMPRLLFAAVAITVSWPVMEWLITLSNDLGTGIRYLIYAPFAKDATNLGGVGMTSFLVGLLSTGALLALGVLGLLSFALTALLAVATAFAILVFRELLVMFLVISAPFAIACYILPNTQKIWNMWKDAFFAVLIVFLIITTFIALGRVFAVVALTSGGNDTLNQIIAILAYILPYFLITTAFRMAGGLMATIGGVVNDRTKGGFDRLRNFRSNQREDRGKRWKSGDLFNSDNMVFKPGAKGWRKPFAGIADTINTAGGRYSLGAKNRYGAGLRGKHAITNAAVAHGEHAAQSDAMKAMAGNDDVLYALASAKTEEEGKAALREVYTEGSDKYNSALQGALSVGFSHTNQLAALNLLPKNKARTIKPGQIDLVEKAIDNASHGNEILKDRLKWEYQFSARNAGRADQGGAWHVMEDEVAALQAQLPPPSATDIEARAVSLGGGQQKFNALSAAEQSTHRARAQNIFANKAKNYAAMQDGIDRTGVQAVIAGHPNALNELLEYADDMVAHGNASQREKAMLMVYEAEKGKGSGTMSDANKELLNKYMFKRGVDQGVEGKDAATVLSKLVGTNDPLSARTDASGNVTYTAAYSPQKFVGRSRTFDTSSAGARDQLINPPSNP